MKNIKTTHKIDGALIFSQTHPSPINGEKVHFRRCISSVSVTAQVKNTAVPGQKWQ
ncbi:hypothetical protein [Candidatus Pantoea multigeneris]|uniref:hypothetical protein n=1 Tax=Candidatus Pantoea multigeneris TaxID=2608357 RepID=UPI00141F0A19|nr:hypothetical protein [Pantoea multigeneris]